MGKITSTRDEAEAKLDQLKGDVKQTVGDLADDRELAREGAIDRAKGQAKEKIVEGKRALSELGED